jgi:regulator of protease activity HflC (stomatin/prohibitin superfamily)
VKAKVTGVVAAIVALALIVGVVFCTETVSPGQVKVGALWGSVQDEELTEGFHVVNPFKTWTAFDCRDKAIDLVIPLQTRDQQTSLVDMTIQFNVIDSSASIALADVGRFEDLVSVQLTPQTRSIARESGKEIKRAEDLFLSETQLMMQDNTLAELNKRLICKGINVQRVLIRNVQLPEHITNAIKAKKVREQQAEEEKAELARFATEQEQKIKQAQAERLAAEEAAEKIKTLADAQAYEIEKINTAMSDNPAYIQLQALETLAKMSKDPATKLYFLNGESSQPFPLLNIK